MIYILINKNYETKITLWSYPANITLGIITLKSEYMSYISLTNIKIWIKW